ncbi:MAG: DUF1194 domain-containing protein [Rhizobiaceae bacterium]|nr:DUF1194 domain-containing protein [Rhizobiaceae bacterium]
MFALKGLLRSFGFGAAISLPGLFIASASAQEVVDVELVLAVDISLSMSQKELEIQRDGYVAAITSAAVIDAIRNGIHGRIALSYIEWAGDQSQYVIVPWTVVAGYEDAERVADMIRTGEHNRARRTSISGGLRFASDLFAESSFRSLKRVVDVSGDGPNNQGEWVNVVRDELVSRGIVINGLPIMADFEYMAAFNIPDLDVYYERCVTGGPGSFVIPVHDWTLFPEAVRRKLVLEIASSGDVIPQFDGLPVILAADHPSYDCQVGEKRWRGRTQFWDETR